MKKIFLLITFLVFLSLSNFIMAQTPAMTSPSSATICSGTTLSISLTSNIICKYSWIANDNPNTSGESLTVQSGNRLNNTLINSSAIIQTVTYTITPTSSLGGIIGTKQIVSVIVMPAPLITSSGLSPTICYGGTINIPLTANIASTFNWLATDNANITGESVISQTGSTINNTVFNTSNSLQALSYTVTPKSTDAGNCLGTSQIISGIITVPKITIINSFTSTVCSGKTLSIPLITNYPSTFSWLAKDNTNTTGESTSIQTGNALNNTIINNTGNSAQIDPT